MKKQRTSLILLGLLVSVLFIGFFSSVVVASSDIDYEFQNDNLFNSTGLGQQSWLDNTSQTFNIRNRENITEIFNATYSFTDDIEGSTPADWVVDDGGIDDSVQILDFGSHDNVLMINDSSAGARMEAVQSFPIVSDAIVEFWWAINNVGETYGITLVFYEDSSPVMTIAINNDDVESFGVGWEVIKPNFIVSDKFFHIRFELDDSANSFDCYINGILEADDFVFQNNNLLGIDELELKTGTTRILITHFDAIGYEWDVNYTEGINIFPLTEVYTEQYEVDKWEFRHNPATRHQYPNGVNHVSGWNHVDIGGASTGTLNIGGDRNIVIHCDDNGGMEREFGTMYDDYFNVSFNFGVNDIADDDVGANAIITRLFDSNGDTIVSTYFRYDGVVEVFSGGTGNIVGTLGDPEANFTITYLINFPSQTINFILSNWNTGEVIYTFFGTFYEPAIDIDEVEYFQLCTGADVIDSDLFSISIYNTTGSISDEVGELLWAQAGFSPEHPQWYFNEFNLIALEGNFQNFSLFHDIFDGIVFKNLISWNTENIDFANIWEDYSLPTSLTYLRLWMYQNFSFNSISIDGAKLTRGSNDYFLNYVYSNVNPNENYFFVIDNRLYFNLDTDDNNLEFIQASFDIPNLITENYSVSFRSNVFGASSCNLRLNYTDSTSSILEFPSHATHTSIILPQEKEVGEVIILITDNDLLSVGSTTGYIRAISFIFFRDISTTITTFSLLTVLVPLMVLIIPPLVMRVRFGNSAVIPMFMLMSIVAFATELIPIWLFFIIIGSSGVFLLGKNKMGVEF